MVSSGMARLASFPLAEPHVGSRAYRKAHRLVSATLRIHNIHTRVCRVSLEGCTARKSPSLLRQKVHLILYVVLKRITIVT